MMPGANMHYRKLLRGDNAPRQNRFRSPKNKATVIRPPPAPVLKIHLAAQSFSGQSSEANAND